MKPETVCCNGRSKEQMQILIASYPDAWLPSADKQYITDIILDNLPPFSGFCISTIFTIDFIYPSCSSVKVAIESKDLTFSKMPVSAEIKAGTYKIEVTGSIIQISATLADK